MKPVLTAAASDAVSQTIEHPRWAKVRPGDLVTTRSGYPILYEVLTVELDGLLRVRGLNWAPGYSAVVDGQDVRPVTGILGAMPPA
jgi:hypothetical protein